MPQDDQVDFSVINPLQEDEVTREDNEVVIALAAKQGLSIYEPKYGQHTLVLHLSYRERYLSQKSD